MQYEPSKGTNIWEACDEAIALAKQNNRQIKFYFNDIYLLVHPSSCPLDTAVIYGLKCELRRLKASPEFYE